jgi:hypothetical protein
MFVCLARECEVRGDDIGGISVHIGARASALAGPNDVLVSSTLRGLVIGSGLKFEERGDADAAQSVPSRRHCPLKTLGSARAMMPDRAETHVRQTNWRLSWPREAGLRLEDRRGYLGLINFDKVPHNAARRTGTRCRREPVADAQVRSWWHRSRIFPLLSRAVVPIRRVSMCLRSQTHTARNPYSRR